jgi:hypothetical protein
MLRRDLITATAADTPARLALEQMEQFLQPRAVRQQGYNGLRLLLVVKVLQVVSATTSTQTVLATTTLTDTGITATITPTSATSKILIIMSIAVKYDMASAIDMQTKAKVSAMRQN